MSLIVGALIALVIGIALAVTMTPSPKNTTKPAALDEIDIPSIEEGKPKPIIFGKVRVKSPFVGWYGDLYQQDVKTKGGK